MVGDLVLSGLTMGSVYALIGLAFVIILLATGFINFAQGDMVMGGAFLALVLVKKGVPILAAIVPAVVVVALLGLLMERLVLRRIWTTLQIGEPPIKIIMATLAISLIMHNAALNYFGGYPFPLPALVAGPVIDLGFVRVVPRDIAVLVTAIAAMGGLGLFFRYSITGIALRAVMIDRDAASLMGVRLSRTVGLSFAIGAGLAALAGILIGPLVFVQWNMGFIAVKAFAGVLLGGIYSIPGGIIGCLMLGVIENLVVTYVSSAFRDVIIYSVLILTLLFKPEGLFGAR